MSKSVSPSRITSALGQSSFSGGRIRRTHLFRTVSTLCIPQPITTERQRVTDCVAATVNVASGRAIGDTAVSRVGPTGEVRTFSAGNSRAKEEAVRLGALEQGELHTRSQAIHVTAGTGELHARAPLAEQSGQIEWADRAIAVEIRWSTGIGPPRTQQARKIERPNRPVAIEIHRAIDGAQAIKCGITHVRGARVTIVTSLGIRYGLAAIEHAAQVLRATDPVIADRVVG